MKRFAMFLTLAAFLATGVAYAGEWTGKVQKHEGKLSFVAGKSTYSITNPDKAAGFEGKTVKVTGSTDAATKSLTITTIAPAAAAVAPVVPKS